MCEYCDVNSFAEWNEGEVTLHMENREYTFIVKSLDRLPQEYVMPANYCFNCGKKLTRTKEEVQISYRVYSCSSEIDYISNKGLAETIQDAWNYEANVYDIEGNSIFESWLDNDEQNELLEPFLLEVFDYGKYRYLRRKDTKLVYLSKWQINPFKDNKEFKYKLV